jgi:hypothetical protein
MSLNYSAASYFRVEVTARGRPVRAYPFNGRIIGDGNNISDALVLSDGRFSFPVMSRSDRAVVQIINDKWLPSSFTSAEWKGTFNPSTRQQ